jgi:hypothetical protein
MEESNGRRREEFQTESWNQCGYGQMGLTNY